MSTQVPIFVKVPFCHGQHQFKIFKGQRWGVVDHLLLQQVVISPCSATELSEVSGLPRRLIIEIMIPFMKVGWIQILQQNQSYIFQATPRGMAVALGEDLPIEKEPTLSFRQFIIDPITGGCYRVGGRQQNFQIYGWHRAKELAFERKEHLIEIDIARPHSNPEFSDIFECVTEEDEEVVGCEDYAFQKPYSQTVKYIFAIVHNDNVISGIPSNVSPILRDQILNAATKKRDQIRILESVASTATAIKHKVKIQSKTYPSHSLNPGDYEILLGASSHHAHLLDVISMAKTRLIIHSTFINTENFRKIFDALVAAARRSVQIDILWGQVEPEMTGAKLVYQNTIATLQEINDELRKLALNELFVIHSDPTGSHSKIILHDDASGAFCATVGSCNWLASGFNRFEASVYLKQPDIVLEVMNIVSQLAKGLTKISNNLSRRISVLANHLKKQSCDFNISKSAMQPQAQIILKGEHHEFIRRARDEAASKIFVCSHRISHVSDRPIIFPLKASKKHSEEIQARVFYGAVSGGMKKDEVRKLAEELEGHGIKLEKIDHPTIHAKILTWDADNSVITSLNWLSASAAGNDYDEIGIYIKDNGIVELIEKEFYANIGNRN